MTLDAHGLSRAVRCGWCGAGFPCYDCGGLGACYCDNNRQWTSQARKYLSHKGYCRCDHSVMPP